MNLPLFTFIVIQPTRRPTRSPFFDRRRTPLPTYEETNEPTVSSAPSISLVPTIIVTKKCVGDNKMRNLNECVRLYQEFCNSPTLYQENREKCFGLGFAPPSEEEEMNEVEFGGEQDTNVALIE